MDYPAYPPIFWNVEASRYATSLHVGNQPLNIRALGMYGSVTVRYPLRSAWSPFNYQYAERQSTNILLQRIPS